jgi:hypothetical protein
MIPENALAIAFFLFGVLLLVMGIRIIIRRQATITLKRSKEIRYRNINLNLTEGRALLFGAGVLVLGIRVVAAYAMTWMEGGDVTQAAVSGGITTWSIVALVIAVVWHLLVKARSVYENPEIRKKISDNIQKAMDEKDER